MNPIIRNLISVVRRFKLAASLNILGLSVAFAAFMVIVIQLDYDYNFDKCHQDYDKIFRVEIDVPEFAPTRVPMFCCPIADFLFESSPHIVAGAISQTMGGSETYFHVETDNERNYFKERSIKVSPDFFDVFTFNFVEGSTIAPGSVFIPQSLARKAFGNESAVGKQIIHSVMGNQTVMAVYRDFPSNSIIENCMYFVMQPDEGKDDLAWARWKYNAFIRVNDAANVPLIIDNFMKNFKFPEHYGFFNLKELHLTVLPDIHFLPDLQWDQTPKSSRQMLLILFAIGIVIIAIAAINFTNFSTALTPMRIKNINTQRVLGVRRQTIRRAIVFEVLIISILSWLIAIVLVMLFQTTPLAKLIDGDLSLTAHPLIIGGTVVVAMLAGLFAGLYPAHYMTSFAPALVLKGNFGLSPKGRNLRNTLIGIQYVASFVLMIGASFMFLQNYFMQNSPLGYNKDRLITVDIGRIQNSRDAFINNLKAYPGIEDVTYAEMLLSSKDQYSGGRTTYQGKDIMVQSLYVHHTFLKVMGIEVTDGRDFRPEDENKSLNTYILNETARRQLNIMEESVTMPSGVEIIGFIPDIKFASFRTAVEPMEFCVRGAKFRNDNLPCVAYIKLNPATSMRSAMSHIHSTLADFDAGYPFEVRFFDEVLQRLYEKETSLSSLISLFSIMAIFISIVGVFGLVVFDSECRRKEIGIRKVLGASTIGIIIMFNKAYFKILVICFVIAAPLAWYSVTRWLENFAYKTPMYWWVYLLAFVAVGMITAGTITFQSWRVANENPANTIKTE